MKRCSKCGIKKSLDAFHKTRRRADGRQSRCRECVAWMHKLRTYNVTQEQYEEMYTEQEGICPLCELFFEALCIDHDHETGKVRGLLCISCNRALGYFENLGWHRRAKRYLRAL